MNKARKEMILAIWEQYEAAKAAIDRQYIVQHQELIAEWAQENDVDMNDQSDLEKIQEQLQEDEDLVAKSQELSLQATALFQQLLFEQVIPALDQTKIDCKDGIIMPDDVKNEQGSIIIPGA